METIKKIHLTTAGTLAQHITEQEKNTVTYLKISGQINLNDFDVLDDMCTSDGYYDDYDNYIMNENKPPFLKVLDLGDCIMEGKAILNDFTYYSKLEEVILPQNLESTGEEETFRDSVFLTKVVCPDTLKEIGYGSFINCEKLESINLPDGLVEICDLAFSGCEKLKGVKIPQNAGLTGGAFAYCYNMDKFEIDENHTHFTIIDGILFNKDKTKLIAFPSGHKNKNYIVPDGVKIIGDSAFRGSKIETITFPTSLETIEDWSFCGCYDLQTLDIPDSVTEIGEFAFKWCKNLSQVRLPNDIKTIKEQTFSGCDKIKEVQVSKNVFIDRWAFSEYTKIIRK